MIKQRVAAALTVVVLLAALGVAVVRKANWRTPDLLALARTLKPAPLLKPEPPQPQDTVYAMLNAARAGDVQSYLGNFTGPMEAALRQSLRESGEAAFARYLVQSNAEVKGVAVTDPQPVSESQVRVRVECVYPDRNEAQTIYLERGPNGWKISRTDADERLKTLIPYGTPVR